MYITLECLRKFRSGWSISRILSRKRIYLGKTSPLCSCGLPENQMSRANSLSCLTLHRMGVTWPCLLPNTPVVSYTTFSTLRSETRYVSVARSRSSRLSRCYLASCSMVYGLSSLWGERARPTNLNELMIAELRASVH